MTPTPGHALSPEAVSFLLGPAIPARLATLDAGGYPRVVPIWFLWEDGAFIMTSTPQRQHVRDLRRDPRAAICVDVEERQAVDGVRANAQVRGRGRTVLAPDEAGYWTRRISKHYVPAPDGDALAERRAAMSRPVIMLRLERLIAIGTARVVTPDAI